MAKEWIEDLAQDIKQRNREAAEEYGRAQHYAGIVADRGREFFVALVSLLQENVDALRGRLQGDPASADTKLHMVNPDEVRISRARFPWVDARVIHRDDSIALDYAKGLGLPGDPSLDRKTHAFVFKVAPDDALLVEDAFTVPPQPYGLPEDLARHIMQLLFTPDASNGIK